MKRYLRSAALLLIGLSTAIPVLAECPEGKSEVMLMTPSGKTKTICVSDNAIPGIENAAEHNAGFTLEPECPCMEVWDGEPYPENTVKDGTPPVLPEQLPEGTCEAFAGPLGMEVSYIKDSPSTDVREAYLATIITPPYEGRSDNCLATGAGYVSGEPVEGSAYLGTGGLDAYLFTDAEISPGGIYTSAMMDACKAALEARGCMFQATPSLGDRVWDDVNANGIQDCQDSNGNGILGDVDPIAPLNPTVSDQGVECGDSSSGGAGIAGVDVNLLNPGQDDVCNTGDEVVLDTTVTGVNGLYLFENLIPGDYCVGFVRPAGFDFTHENQGNDDALDSDADSLTGATTTITLDAGETNLDLDCGLILAPLE